MTVDFGMFMFRLEKTLHYAPLLTSSDLALCFIFEIMLSKSAFFRSMIVHYNFKDTDYRFNRYHIML